MLCGDLFDIKTNSFVAYRQIPISQIKNITQNVKDKNEYTLHVNEFQTLDELESMNAVSGDDRHKQKEKMQNIKQNTVIILHLSNLDKYFKNKKRKELKQKHIGAILKLYSAKQLKNKIKII